MTEHVSPTEDQALHQPYGQFILFGDSLTEMSSSQDYGFGFHAALQHDYSRRLDVINRGFSGYNTSHALKVLPRFFPFQTASVKIMTIFFGCNDACLPGNYQHIPLDIYRENLREIIQHPVVKAQNPRILILTPPPVNEYQLEAFDASEGVPHPSRTANQTRKYAGAASDVALSLGVPIADLWTAFMEAVEWREGDPLIGSREVPNHESFQQYFTDGLHLTAKGYRLVYRVVRDTIKQNGPGSSYGFSGLACSPDE
ncbi:GDSL lipase/acylhydrolase family protein [Aspergillus luchuensis IFO 4308]|nr:GDSL lipase/acylhydrolase family protein [Aspergillus luchuensis IFO 4308]